MISGMRFLAVIGLMLFIFGCVDQHESSVRACYFGKGGESADFDNKLWYECDKEVTEREKGK